MTARCDVERILQPFFGYGRCVVTAEVSELRRVCRCMETVAKEHFDSILEEAASVGAPVMMIHQSDGMGCDMQQTEIGRGPAFNVTRVARHRAELLLELVVVKSYTATGNFAQGIRFFAPRLMEGKTGWHVFGSSMDCPSLFHHEKVRHVIKIDIFLQDGLHAAGMRKKQDAWQRLLYDTLDDGDEDGNDMAASDTRDHLHWTLGWRCILHVAQSACKWGLAPVLSETIQHDAHCLVKSLINSSGPIFRRMDEFIYTRLYYDDSPMDVDATRTWWATLGVPEGPRMDAILEVNPRWDAVLQVLRVSEDLQSDPQGHSKVRCVIMFCFQWKNWSDTRWMGMRQSGALYLRSKAVGIDYFADMVATAEGSSNDKHYIHGYRRFGTTGAKLALAVAPVALLPLNWFMEQLLIDDRFLLQARALELGVMERCVHVASLPDSFWRRLSEAGGLLARPWEVRHVALACMRTGIAYLGSEGFGQLQRYPLSLTQGDIDENLKALGEETGHLDPVTENIRLCWRLDPGPSRTSEAVELVRHAACSTGLCEKGHAPTRLHKRQHGQLEMANLRLEAHAHLHSSFYRLGQHDRQIRKLRDRYEGLLEVASGKLPTITPKMMLLHDLHCGTGGGRPEHLAGCSAATLMREHHAIYRDLGHAEKSDLARRAGLLGMEKAAARLSDAAGTLAKIREERAKKEGKTLPGIPVTVEASRYNDRWVARFLELYESLGMPSAQWTVESERASCPEPPSEEVQRLILAKAQEVAPQAGQPRMEPWARIVCQNRESFKDCGLCFADSAVEEGGCATVLMPMHICQQPENLHFVSGRRLEPDDALDVVDSSLTLSINHPVFDMVWLVDAKDLGRPLESASREFGENAIIHVVPHIVHAGNLLCTRARPVPFDEFVGSLPTREASTRGARRTDAAAIPPDFRARLLEEYPWFTDEDIRAALRPAAPGRGGGCGGDRGRGGGGGDGGHPGGPPEPLGDDAAVAALQELEEYREMWRWDEQVKYAHFYVFDRGGPSTKAKKDVSSDCVATLARSHVHAWCDKFKCQKMHSFMFSKHSESFCHALAREWCRKQSYYYEAWLRDGGADGGAPDFPSGVAPFAHSDEYYDALEDVPCPSPTFARFIEVNEWLPRAAG